MCGIIGILGKDPAAPLLVEALKRLEYRGYDSAGVATLVNGKIDRRRAEGKLVKLESLLGRITSGRQSADHICRLCDEDACPQESCPVECAVASE